jgi:hypothetical protein
MNIIDENIPESQRSLLRVWRSPVRQIGHEVGRKGMKDEEIIPLLHQLPRPTFFTRDRDFDDPNLRHADYCLVSLAVGQYEVASFIRRFFAHPSLNTYAKRMGKVVLVTHSGLTVWRTHRDTSERLPWSP